ncbi:ATP-dependent zinc protease [Thalassospira sp.]|uniref:ATP-dependent zinc protease family protein n=1 Tax=Thalassospira sp. TaxID=1912094 RepID=UPI0027371338|nr:ATP-dependent zinc protease [Thalassospira sp.]MDP2696916.1 ATP-dependent zinc protease [Thalassospira sp.]
MIPKTARPTLKIHTDALKDRGHLVGWREWVSLPDFGVWQVKAKVDTGARTSSLHATHIKMISRDGRQFVKFNLPHYRGDGHGRVACEAPLADIREIRSSNGEVENRYVISTHIGVGAHRLKVEMTLANRTLMGFPMLLGRTALRAGKFLVQPGKSYLAGKPEPVYIADQPGTE